MIDIKKFLAAAPNERVKQWERFIKRAPSTQMVLSLLELVSEHLDTGPDGGQNKAELEAFLKTGVRYLRGRLDKMTAQERLKYSGRAIRAGLCEISQDISRINAMEKNWQLNLANREDAFDYGELSMRERAAIRRHFVTIRTPLGDLLDSLERIQKEAGDEIFSEYASDVIPNLFAEERSRAEKNLAISWFIERQWQERYPDLWSKIAEHSPVVAKPSSLN